MMSPSPQAMNVHVFKPSTVLQSHSRSCRVLLLTLDVGPQIQPDQILPYRCLPPGTEAYVKAAKNWIVGPTTGRGLVASPAAIPADKNQKKGRDSVGSH